MFCCIYVNCCIIFFFFHWLFTKFTRTGVLIRAKNICVTGGSEGIGFAIAKACVIKGAATVTIIARDPHKLQTAFKSLKEVSQEDQVIQAISCDVGKPAAIQCVIQQLTGEIPVQAEEKDSFYWVSTITKQEQELDCLVNSAGLCIPDYLEKLTDEDVLKQVNTNIIGSIIPSRTAFAYWKKLKNDKKKTIVLLGSVASQINIFGYSVYGATKYAIRGFWEALNMEALPFNINVICVFPPDTDTPGLNMENKRKPELTKILESNAGLYSADCIAKNTIKAIENGNSMVTVGFFGTAIASVTTGFGPHSSILEFLCHLILMPIVKIVSLGVNFYFKYLIQKEIRPDKSICCF